MVVNRARLSAAVVALSLSVPAFAEEVYEFGSRLIEEFGPHDRKGFVDLAHDYFERAAEDRNLTREERIEATLGLGTVSKLLAERQHDPKKKEQLYSEAQKLASDFLSKAGRGHPKRHVASSLLATIERDLARAKIRAAKEETDIARRKQLLAEARDIYEKVVKKRKEAREAAWKKFDEFEQEYQEYDKGWQDKRENKEKRNKLAREATEAMQLYYQDMLSYIKVFEEESLERKSQLDALIEELTEEVEERWKAEEFKGVGLSARFFLGQAYALANDYEKAKTEGFDHVLEEDSGVYRGPGLKWIRSIQLHAFYFKAKAAFDAKEYDDAAMTARAMLNPPRGYPDARNEEIGKAAYLLQGEAYAAQEKYDEAIQAVIPVSSAGGQWVVNANKAISEWMDLAKKKGKKVQADAMVHYYSGDGHYRRALSAREKKDHEEKERMFELTVSDLAEAIRLCRGKGTSLLSRYKYEPRCWQQMGLAYYYLGLFYESALSFEAVLKNFAPHLVGQELARRGQYGTVIKRIRKKLAEDEEEKPTDAMVYAELFNELAKRQEYKAILPKLAKDVKKSANNFKVALKARKKQSKTRFDAQLYAYALKLLIEVDPARRHEAEFYLAQELEDEAGRAKADGRPKEALDTYLRAVQAYLKVSKRARLHEVALFKAATGYYRIMSILAKRNREKAAEYGRKAIEQFQVYLDHIASTPTTDDLLRKQREKYSGDVLLYTPLTRFALGEYEEAIKGFGGYLAREDRDPKYVPLMAWNRFKSYYQLARDAAGGGDLDGFDGFVGEAEKLASGMPDDPTMEKYYVTACNYMVAAYGKAASAAEGKGLQGKYASYQAKLAESMKTIVDYDPERADDWQFMMQTGRTFHRLEMYEKAVEMFSKALEKLDPDKDLKGGEIPESPDFWAALKKKIMLVDPETTAEVRKDMDLIRDYIFDEEGVRDIPPEERKEELIDYAKALTLVIGIIGDERKKKGKYPEIKIKPFLVDLRKELIIRLGIQHIRKLTSECYPAMAREAEAQDDTAKAKECWAKAAEDFEKLLVYFWADTGLRVSLADALAAVAKYETDEAKKAELYERVVDLYAEISIWAERDSEDYYTALVKRARALFAAGRWEDARKFPKLLLDTEPDMVEEYFADAAEFVEKCEKKMAEEGIDLRKGPKVVIRGPFLFGADPGLQSDLENGSLSDAFLKEFKAHGVSFSANVAITPEEEGSRWRITDVDTAKTYTAEKTDKALNIYKDLDYGTYSTRDKKLRSQVARVHTLVKLGKLKAEKRDAEILAVYKFHLKTALRMELSDLKNSYRNKNITKERYEASTRKRVLNYLYSSPFSNTDMRNEAAKLGLVDEKFQGCKIEFLDGGSKKFAIGLKYLTEDGKKHPEAPAETEEKE